MSVSFVRSLVNRAYIGIVVVHGAGVESGHSGLRRRSTSRDRTLEGVAGDIGDDSRHDVKESVRVDDEKSVCEQVGGGESYVWERRRYKVVRRWSCAYARALLRLFPD